MLKNLARLISLSSSPFILLLPTPFILVFKETGNIFYSLKWTFFSYIFLFSVVFFGIILGIFTISLVNNWIKASIHTATVSAFTLSLVILFGYMFIPILLLIPAMAWARVKIKKHTPQEAIVGGFLGTVLTIIVYTIGRFIF